MAEGTKLRKQGTGHKPAIILIGFGTYAHSAHVPPLIREVKAGKCRLVAVVDLPKSQRKPRHMKYFDELIKELGEKGNIIKYIEVDPDTADVGQLGSLMDLEDELKGKVVGVIISTTEIAHKKYLQWALQRGYHVVVDKPITINPYTSCKVGAAQGLVSDLDELLDLSIKKRALFMVAAQKRYPPGLFTKIAALQKEMKIRNQMIPITDVTVRSNDGYWVFAKDEQPDSDRPPGITKQAYAFRDDKGVWRAKKRYDARASGAGELAHTSYHLLDVVPWLMRQVNMPVVKKAEVYARFQKPADIIAKFPFHRKKNGSVERVSEEEAKKVGRAVDLMDCNEVNAIVVITFQDRKDHALCTANLTLQHEGCAFLTKDDIRKKGRVKTEQIVINYMPFEIKFERYNVKLAPRRFGMFAKPGGFGGKEHRDLKTIRPGQCVKTYHVKEDDDTAPVREFLQALQTNDPSRFKSRSLAKDHRIAVRLLASAYESAICGQPKTVDLSQVWPLQQTAGQP